METCLGSREGGHVGSSEKVFQVVAPEGNWTKTCEQAIYKRGDRKDQEAHEEKGKPISNQKSATHHFMCQLNWQELELCVWASAGMGMGMSIEDHWCSAWEQQLVCQ